MRPARFAYQPELLVWEKDRYGHSPNTWYALANGVVVFIAHWYRDGPSPGATTWILRLSGGTPECMDFPKPHPCDLVRLNSSDLSSDMTPLDYCMEHAEEYYRMHIQPPGLEKATRQGLRQAVARRVNPAQVEVDW